MTQPIDEFEKALRLEKFMATEQLTEIPAHALDTAFEFIRSQNTKSFASGARWARQYTVAEVCKMLRDNYINGGKGMADFIEQHFKDRGTK